MELYNIARLISYKPLSFDPGRPTFCPVRVLGTTFLSISLLWAAFERVPQGPLNVGSGFTTPVVGLSELDFLTHPASLARIEHTGFSVLYSSPFQLTALDQYTLSIALPSRLTNWGIAFSSLGKGIYRETTVSVGTGRTVGQHMEMGVLVNAHELSIKNYGTSRTVGISLSVTYGLTETIRWSLLYRNLNSPKLGQSREFLPQVVVTAFDFSPTPSLITAVELERDLEFRTRYKFGVRWQPLDVVAVATGFASHPGQVTGGVSFEVEPWGQISYGIATHPELAISQVFAIRLTLP